MLHDRDLAKAEGEAWDIADTIPLLSAMEILPAANYTDLGDSHVVVVTVGATVTPGQSRLDVLGANASVISGIMGQLDETCPGAVVILVSNPVDVLARIAIEASPRPPGRVLGCWTVLDGARLRHQLGTLLNLERESIHAYVIGEHGDSSFPSGQALPPGRSGSRNTSPRGRLMATDQGGADRLDPGPRGEHPPAQGLHQLRCGGGSRPYRPCCHPGREAHPSWSPLWRQRSTASGPWRSACPAWSESAEPSASYSCQCPRKSSNRCSARRPSSTGPTNRSTPAARRPGLHSGRRSSTARRLAPGTQVRITEPGTRVAL
jgi:hypothetical protein